MLKIIIIVSALLLSGISLASPIAVEFINPGHESDNATGHFWPNVSKVMETAAADLNIQLSVKYAKRNHIVMKSLVKAALNGNSDYLILVNEKASVIPLLLKEKANNKKLLFLLNGPSAEQNAKLHQAGYQVLGSIVPDNFQAGFTLMAELSKKASATKAEQGVLALLGDVATPAALDRQKGMNAFVSKHEHLQLLAQVNSHWSQQDAYRITKAWLTRAPELTIVWAANDPMAYGALQAALDLDRTITVGGVNWDSPIAKQLDVSMGGHVLLGAYALVQLRAFHLNQSEIGLHRLAIFRPLQEQYWPLYEALHGNFPKHLDFLRYINNNNRFTIKDINESIIRNEVH
ncbi:MULTISPECIES: ABC transporter substrate-binding protein [unclassified Pseudoalteromonas]|uniref:ABC transporter substrate-binding protein n=1 Tax=unclassified Pseudoalteromonas TaxID=194690 RepID=UPI0030157469